MAQFTRREIQLLERLRARFLAGSAGVGDYWEGAEELELYDRTFAERIGWKCDAVLSELSVRGWTPRSRHAVDWACGTGVAGRRLLEHWPGQFDSLALYDRSPLAAQFAESRARAAFPGVSIKTAAAAPPFEDALVFISHVINEMTPGEVQQLTARLAQAREIVWIEAGTHRESRRLVEEVREPLLAASGFVPIAPCTHAARCGLRTPDNERHWCHSFGRAPSEVFQDARWAEFARTLSIDLRSLPFSFLVLARAADATAGPDGHSRMLGHPRDYKGHSKILSCQSDGVYELMIQKREAPELLRRLHEDDHAPIYRWQREGSRITGG